MSWGCWKHSFGIPGVRPMFLKPKLHKESKNGFKTISCRCYPVMIFSKNCFRCKTIIKNIDVFLIFEFFWQYIWINQTSFKKFNCRMFRISWNITKMLKTEQFFHMWLFIRCFLAIIATIGFSRPQTPDFRKSHIWKNCSVFNFLVILQFILNILQLNLLKLV